MYIFFSKFELMCKKVSSIITNLETIRFYSFLFAQRTLHGYYMKNICYTVAPGWTVFPNSLQFLFFMYTILYRYNSINYYRNPSCFTQNTYEEISLYSYVVKIFIKCICVIQNQNSSRLPLRLGLSFVHGRLA